LSTITNRYSRCFSNVSGRCVEVIEATYPGRVFAEAIHTGPSGAGTFQFVDLPDFPHDFTCAEGVAIGQHFGLNWPGSPFGGNPFGAVSRADGGNGYPVQAFSDWPNSTSAILTTNDLKVNLQTITNYYSSTRGLFVHVEADILDAGLTNELKLVVQLVEDSIVQPQLYPASEGFPNNTDVNYIHRDVLRASLDGSTFGQTLDTAHLDANGKYYFDYIYELPMEYESTNTHIIIYVRDTVTEEIYHVIEKHF